jgi:NADPH:quinone reductase-like Zn-dependent oxidoreductase
MLPAVLGIDQTQSVEDYVIRHTQGRGFDIVFDAVGGATLDASFQAVRRFGHVVSALGSGTHALAPLSFRAASHSGVFTLLPLLTSEGRAHHREILREATKLVAAGKVFPRLDPRHYRCRCGLRCNAMKVTQHFTTSGTDPCRSGLPEVAFVVFTRSPRTHDLRGRSRVDADFIIMLKR